MRILSSHLVSSLLVSSLLTSSLLISSVLIPTLVFGTLAITLAGCPDREVARVDPRQNREQEKEIPVQINRNIDILFIVDNSGSMREEQASLAANFNRFINVLNNIEGGLPNVHIGVISTDIGAGPYGIGGCTGNGDNGILQNSPSGACSTPGPELYIINTALEDGSRSTNYTGGLAETFSCIAKLGTSGCGFEQPLEAMRRALNGSNAQNNGFLRDDAFLAVIIISDEDDCSVEKVSMFDSDPALDNLTSNLGPLSSFRCFEFGVVCEPDTPRSAGPRQNCMPRDGSEFMYDVSEYANFLKSLKDDPAQIIVAGITGDPTPVKVLRKDAMGDPIDPTLDYSCTDDIVGDAAPGVRLQAFLDSFPNRNTRTTICNDDLSDALTVIADLLAKVIGNPCIEGNLVLTDGQPECTVADVRYLNQDGQEESIIPLCDSGMSTLPCYHFEVDAEQCAATPTQLTLVIERGPADVPSQTTVVARCVAQ